MTKLVFGGVAAGIALSSAVLVATFVPFGMAPATDASIPVTHTEVKPDRPALTPASQQVATGGKADALDFAISILRGSDIELGDRIAPPESGLAAFETEPAAPPSETATAAMEPEALPVIDPSAVADQPQRPQVRPVPRARTVVTIRSEPVNIIPTPAPTDNRPVTAPAAATTNFSAEPIDTNDALRDRQDLVR